MREYAHVHDHSTEKILIIARDPHVDPDAWWIYQKDVSDTETAKEIVDALNAFERN